MNRLALKSLPVQKAYMECSDCSETYRRGKMDPPESVPPNITNIQSQGVENNYLKDFPTLGHWKTSVSQNPIHQASKAENFGRDFLSGQPGTPLCLGHRSLSVPVQGILSDLISSFHVTKSLQKWVAHSQEDPFYLSCKFHYNLGTLSMSSGLGVVFGPDGTPVALCKVSVRLHSLNPSNFRHSDPFASHSHRGRREECI